MRTEYEVMEALKSFTLEHIAEEYDALPSASSLLGDIDVVMSSPDPDNMPSKDVIYLEFNNGESEEDTVMSDKAAMAIDVFFVCARETQEVLQKKCWGYYSAFYKMLKKDQSLGGAVDLAYLSDWEWYPYVTAKPGASAIKAIFVLTWQKTFVD